MEEFSTTDITRSLEIPKERFRTWIDNEYIGPSIQRGKGYGTKNIFSRLDVYAIALFKHLIESSKLPRRVAQFHVEHWIKEVKHLPTSPQTAASIYNRLVFVKMGGQVVNCLTTSDYADVLDQVEEMYQNDWDDLLIINISKIIKAVDKALS